MLSCPESIRNRGHAVRVVLLAALLLPAVPAWAQPTAPTLIAPADGSDCVLPDGLLRWNGVSGAVRYDVTLYPGGLSIMTPATSVMPEGLIAGQTYQWEVRATNDSGATGPPSARRSFTCRDLPAVPVPGLPPDGADCQPVARNLAWTAVNGATSYRLLWGPAGGLLQELVTAVPSVMVSGLLPGTTYAWQVSAIDDCGYESGWSTMSTFTTAAPALAAPARLLPPLDGCRGTEVRLRWSVPSGSVHFRVEWGLSGGAVNQVVTTQSSFDLDGLEPDAAYEWRVRAVDACGTVGDWAGPFAFGTAALLGEPASAAFPPDEATCLPTLTTLSWSPVPGATLYDVRWGPPTHWFRTAEVGATSVSSGELLPGTSYVWEVRARDACGNPGEWSPTFGFRTVPWQIVAPQLLAPADGATCVSPTSTLRWRSVPDASRYVLALSPGNLQIVTEDTTLTMPSLPGGVACTWQVQAVSDCGQQGAWSAVATFSLDTEPPVNPGIVKSLTQTPRQWTSVTVPHISWNHGTDACEVAGYSLVVDDDDRTVPDLVIEATGNALIGPPLPEGTDGWIHLRTIDRAGNGATGAAHVGPYWIDATPPTVVFTEPSADLQVAAGGTVRLDWAAGDAPSGLAALELRASADDGHTYPLFIASPATTQRTFDWAVPGEPGDTWRVQLRAVDLAGNESVRNPRGVIRVVESVSGVPASDRRTALLDIRPNPANPRAAIRYSLAAEGAVRLTVHDLAGRSLRTLRAGVATAGAHEARWDGNDQRGLPAPSGVYLVRLEAGGVVERARLTLVR
jgi:hypothetical protein